jgi:hypothetical protein
MKLKLQDFRDQGYSVIRCSATSVFEADTYKWLCHKAIWDSKGKKYVINAYISDIRLWGLHPDQLKHAGNQRTITLKLFFDRGPLNFRIDINNDQEFTDIEDIEYLVDVIWYQLDMDYCQED